MAHHLGRTLMAKCAHCDEESITNLDGDELCQKHADEWCRGEGDAFYEQERREAEEGEG
jgi:hypothetical protein